MPVPILPKRRSADATAPTTANLIDGEVAINSFSKTIYQRVGSNIIPVANYFSGAWTDLTNKPTTRDGFGIVDVPKTDGTSATGDWSINITGSAGYVNATDLRNVTPNTAGISTARAIKPFFAAKEQIEGGSGSTYGDFLVLDTYTDNSGGKVNGLLALKGTQALYHYQGTWNATSWDAPKQIAYTDSNITGSAAKLTTARTVALSGKATGTATAFDGSANISIPITALTVDAADVTTGVFNTGRLGTGTADNTKYLRGDGTWATVTASAPANMVTTDTTQSIAGAKTFTSTVTINRGLNTPTSSSDIVASNGSHNIYFGARSAPGAYNPLTLDEDKLIVFTNGAIGQGGLAIVPWSDNGFGLRLSADGSHTLGGNLTFKTPSGGAIRLQTTTSSNSFDLGIGANGTDDPDAFIVNRANGAIKVYTNNLERAQWNAAGNFRQFYTGMTHTGAVGTQTILHEYGWNNGVSRWKWVIEDNGSHSVFSYDTSGGTPTRSINITSAVAGGANIATFNGIVKCGTGNGDKALVPSDDAAIWDVNILHTLGIKSESDVNQGFIKFGAGPRLGYDGTTNNITVEGCLRSITSSAGYNFTSRAGGKSWTWYDPDGGGAVLDESGVGTVVRFKGSGSYINSSFTFNGSNNLYFGLQVRQMINLWGSSYGIGVQGNTQYFRTGDHFAWYKGGSHSDGVLDPGGGVKLASLDNGGNLSVGSGIYAPYGLYDNGQRTWSRNTRPELDTYAQTIGDWNNALSFGVYMAAGAANQPVADGGWFIGIVTQHNANWVQQEAWRFTDGPTTRRYYRHNQNGTWSAWTSDRIVGVMNADRVSLGWDSGVNGSLSANNWVRLTGAVGLYMNDYGGGVWMNDTTYVRAYNGKSMYAQDFVSPSDERLKKDIKPFEEGRKYVLSDNAVRYAWRSDDREEYGFIAQTILPHYPEIIDEVVMEVEGEDGMMVSDPNGETRYVLNYHKAVPILAGELKSAREEISELRDRLDRIEKLLIQRNH